MADCKEEELFSAYSSRDIDCVISITGAGTSPFITDDKGNTLFHFCCTNNTDGLRILQSILTTTTTVPFPINNDGNTPLHFACSNGLIECVQLLLSRSPDIGNAFEYTNNAGLSPLYYASKAGHIDIVRLAVLRSNQLSFNNVIQCITDAASWEIIQLLLMRITLRGLMDTCNKHEDTQHFLRLFPKNNQLSYGLTTFLHLVATSGDLEYFTATVSIGLDINCFDSEGYTPLHRAIEYGCVSIAKYLINQPNCLCETLTRYSIAPLHDAAGEYGDLSIVQCLVERGVDINVSTWVGTTPLHYSCRWGHLSIVEYLTSLPQFYYTRDSYGRTGIHYAAEFGQAHVVKYLTEVRGYDINVEDKYGNTPLYMACMYDHLPVVEYLTTQPNCNINSSNNGSHPLIVATQNGNLEIVKVLTNHLECNTEAENVYISRPLHIACNLGYMDILHHLVIDKYCDVNVKGLNGTTPLHVACIKGQYEVVKFLTSHTECNIEAENDFHNKPLHVACISGNVDIVHHLVIDKHCNINVKGQNGYTPLHWACDKGQYEVVQFLTSHTECNIEAEDDSHDKPLHVACTSGNVDIVRHLVIDKQCDINVKGQNGYTPLHWACDKGQYEVVQFLTSHTECNIEAENDFYNKPLHVACAFGSVDIVRHLVIDKQCDINVKGQNGYTPLHWTCDKGQYEVVQFLTSHTECNIEAENDFHNKPLHVACISGNVDIVRHLVIDEHCNINVKGWNGYTPLHWACDKGQYEVVQFLTSHTECNIEAEDDSHDKPLHVACTSGNVDIVRHLVINKQCDINVKGQNGYTPLHWACDKGQYEVVQFLTSHTECNIEAEDDSHNKPLHVACKFGRVDTVRHLVIDKHCDINVKGQNGYTPLHWACNEGRYEVVQFLTSCTGCNIEAENDKHDKPLHVACKFGSIDIVRHLVIDKQCDINVKGQDGFTPLHWACIEGQYKVVQFLTSHTECNIEAENDKHDKPLHVACFSGNVDIVRHLVIDSHCNINVKGFNGYTPLHWACGKGQYKVFRFLTNCTECDIEAEDDDHDKPLHVACISGNVDIVRHLVIDKHCDINVKGQDGYTPLHWACEKGHLKLVQFITDHPQCDMESENIFRHRPLQVAVIYKNIKIINHLVAIKGCNTDGVTTDNRKVQIYLNIYGSSGVASLRVVKCILTGPPGAGKSTLKKRLLNQSLDTEPSLSTGVVDAAVQVNSFRKLSQHNAVATTEWKEQELDEEALLITKKLLPSITTPDKNRASQPTLSSVESTISSSVLPEETYLPLATVKHNTNANSSPEARKITTGETSSMGHENESIYTADISNDDEKEGVTDIQVQDNSSTVVSGLSNYVMSIPARRRQQYEQKFEDLKDEDHTMLHIIDTGGQPEFHEILPALITGPAINLLVFKLTEDLSKRYQIIYRSPAGESKPYETSLTHEEVIFRSLASIACLRQNTIGWSFDVAPIEDKSEPVAFLIATHRDQVEENKVNKINQQLQIKVENSSHLFDSNLVQFSELDQVIFPLDTLKDEEEIKHLRSILHRVISERFHELQIPASWCALSLKLRKSKRKLFKYDTCFQLAQECGIKDKEEFHNALWYLHHRVGIIMYYPNVKGLEDIIMTDLQLVFDRITNLITTCFTFELLGSAAVVKEFRKNGRFSESQLDEISSRQKDDPLNSKRLVALLKHLYIVAGPMKTKVGWKNVDYYFMPCALKPSDVEKEERDKSLSPSPLLICFECGYTPVGVFCCLVVYLLDQKTDQVLQWKLTGNDHHRNRISFKVGQYLDTVVLISRATYLEVWVQQTKGSKLSTSDLCDKILSSLHRGLETVTESLHYTYKSRHMFGVPCTCTTIPHPAVIEFNEEAAECSNGNIMNLNKEQLLWSIKVC